MTIKIIVTAFVVLVVGAYIVLQREVPEINSDNIEPAMIMEYSKPDHFRQTPNDCGPYNVAAVVRALKNVEVSSAEFAEDITWRLPNNYTLPIGLEKQLKENGVFVRAYSLKSFEDHLRIDFLLENLSLKRPVIILGEQDGYEHYITLFGFDSAEDEFYLYDSIVKAGNPGMTTDLNAFAPGNKSMTAEELLEFWRGGGTYGVYNWYAIASSERYFK